ncbi:hypothetical protein [Brevibacillus laterosporus]|uniref:hypothetical protein n=1 Tax=Brevibacillus laterosporus TaxID=1465 RepID=UPI002E209F9A|nr:hypothetical protein [Brevibacillus laterosporus]MED1667166.1 hypothetical protein [Brevibacillus laterosporus]MED1719766.1 hypothetical protein [Brevibacillus laterosporus]
MMGKYEIRAVRFDNNVGKMVYDIHYIMVHAEDIFESDLSNIGEVVGVARVA